MAKVPSKKQRILDLCREKGLARVGEREIRALEAEMRRRAPEDGTSLSYVASVLREAGIQVDYEDRFLDPRIEEPYAQRLDGALRFHDLESAEQSLRKLDGLYREYREASDRVGTTLVRSLVMKGKQRAASLGANPRVGAPKRQEKQEIARWFGVWLENADLFFDWLELRKQSEEYGRAFGKDGSQ